tara:strand:- start:636 stop:1985 length:1350 start_codon:yes stop_codon:yes gene_type:complete
MKKLLFLLLFPLSFFSQTCTYPFSNTIKDIVKTNDGNFVFSSGDFKTTKVDFNFDTIWHQDDFDSTGRSITKIQSTFDGGFIGVVNNSGSYLYKMNSLGDTLWTNEFQIFFGPFGGGINVFEIIQTADSGFAFIGIFGFHGTVSTILVKTDSLGNVLWTKNIAIPNSNSFERKIRTILETSNGDLILSGYVNTFSTTNNNYSLLYKFSNLGDSIWAKNYENFEFNSLQIDNSDNIIIGAEFSDSLNNSETRIIKANSFGDTIWTKKIFANKLNCIELTASGYVFGGYIETGLNNKSPYLLKTNFNGDSLWTRIYEEDSLDRTIKKIFNLVNNEYLLLGDSIFNSSFYNKNINYRTQVDSLGYCQGLNPSKIATKFSPQLVFYPNPTKGNINIMINNFNGNIQTEVFDLIGNRLQVTNETSISLRDYAKGIYILKVAYGDTIEEVKVIKD